MIILVLSVHIMSDTVISICHKLATTIIKLNIIIIASSFKLNVFSLISWTFLLYAFHNFITQAMMLFLTS